MLISIKPIVNVPFLAKPKARSRLAQISLSSSDYPDLEVLQSMRVPAFAVTQNPGLRHLALVILSLVELGNLG